MRSADVTGVLWAIGAVVCFSANDVLVKFLSGGFPLYELIFLRSSVALVFIVTIILPLSADTDTLRTRRLGVHLLRGLCVVVANFCFFLALAALPLADAVAIFFISPLLVAVLSVIFLGEVVGPRRWSAIAFGFIGVLIVVRPGSEAFQVAALLPLIAAGGYATLHIMTRKIGVTETATRMAFYIHITFLAVSGTAGLALGHGRFDVFDHPSAEFLLRPWVWPEAPDLALIAILGVTSAMGGFAISNAYRRAEAALVAPVEYVAMPLALFWGLTLFGEVPDLIAMAGITLILASGVFLVWREALARRPKRI